jgi:hypothetical protein
VHLFNARNAMCIAESLISLVRVRDLDHDAERHRVDLVVCSKCSTS